MKRIDKQWDVAVRFEDGTKDNITMFGEKDYIMDHVGLVLGYQIENIQYVRWV